MTCLRIKSTQIGRAFLPFSLATSGKKNRAVNNIRIAYLTWPKWLIFLGTKNNTIQLFFIVFLAPKAISGEKILTSLQCSRGMHFFSNIHFSSSSCNCEFLALNELRVNVMGRKMARKLELLNYTSFS